MTERFTYPRILVTDADSTKALAIVRALGTEMEVWTASQNTTALARWSRYSKKHLKYDFDKIENLADWVLKKCIENKINVVITPQESSSFILSQAQDKFIEKGVLLTTPPVNALKIAVDKALTIQAAQQVGIVVPETKMPETIEQAIVDANELGYPIVIKPRKSSYLINGRIINTDGVDYADSDDRLISILKSKPLELPFPLLQKFIQGKGFGVFLHIGKNGKLCAEFAHERLRDLRPTGSGSVLRRSIAVDEKLRQLSVKLLLHIGWRGVAMVEYRKDDLTGNPYLMEINGRFWGSLQLATDAGVNFPKILVDDVLGRNIQIADYKQGVILRWWLGDLVRTLSVIKGKPAGFKGQFPSKWSAIKDFIGPQLPGTRNEIFRIKDPMPAIGEVVSIIYKLFT